MAADVSTNPITISAADVAAGAVILWTGNVEVLQVEMEQYTADTDTVILQLLNGKPFWNGNGAADLQTVRSGRLGWAMGGLKVPQGGITNGNMRIYIR